MEIREAALLGIQKLSGLYEEREARNIIRILFEDLFHISSLELTKKFEFENDLKMAIQRLLENEPVQYVTESAHFYGYDFKVNSHVLIPRPETEELVHWVEQDTRNERRQLDILDIGAGSGCIGITLKLKRPSFRVFGIEVSLDALNVSRINSRKLRAPMTFYNFNFLESRYWNEMGLFDIIVSNPPYIDEEDRVVMADNVLLYEPEAALFAGDDPLIFYKQIASFTESHLKEQGRLYLEINERFADETAALFESPGRAIEIRKDLQGSARMIRVTF